MNEPENIIPADEFEPVGDDDFWSDDEDVPIERRNLYDMLENPEICESFIVANHIYVRHTNGFFRDYTQSELNIIRAYFNADIAQAQATEIKGIRWSGDMNTSSFKLCLEYIHLLGSITLNADVGLHGITHMCEALDNNTSVTSLTIDYPIDVNSIRILGAFLETNKTVTNLVMMNYKTTFEAVKVLFSFLKGNTAITHITLYNDSFGTKGAQILPWIIKSPLQSLDINGNTIGSAGNKMLMETLRNNTSLTYLNLKKNSIGDAGMIAITEMLKTNKTLLKIDLSGNGITDKSVKKISEMLENNNTLTHMMLDKNKISFEGFNNLVCLDNLSLTHFFNYRILDNGKVCDTYAPYKVKDVTKLYNWLVRNVRICGFKDSILEFKKAVVGQLPDELIGMVQECL
jgi:hypothetical protein